MYVYTTRSKVLNDCGKMSLPIEKLDIIIRIEKQWVFLAYIKTTHTFNIPYNILIASNNV